VRFHPDEDLLRLFIPSDSWHHQTFRGPSLGPEKGQKGVGRGWVGFHPDDEILRLFGPCDS